ncbi:MAG: hypothetical protein K6G83_15455, partial [Lachnospiraceae bacterium]|nr:hypothetical protein [Lachnospiraceae bacterium]
MSFPAMVGYLKSIVEYEEDDRNAVLDESFWTAIYLCYFNDLLGFPIDPPNPQYEDSQAELLYLDDDEVPEILLRSNNKNVDTEDVMLAIEGDHVVEYKIPYCEDGLSYIPRENKMFCRSSRNNSHKKEETVFSIKDGKEDYLFQGTKETEGLSAEDSDEKQDDAFDRAKAVEIEYRSSFYDLREELRDRQKKSFHEKGDNWLNAYQDKLLKLYTGDEFTGTLHEGMPYRYYEPFENPDISFRLGDITYDGIPELLITCMDYCHVYSYDAENGLYYLLGGYVADDPVEKKIYLVQQELDEFPCDRYVYKVKDGDIFILSSFTEWPPVYTEDIMHVEEVAYYQLDPQGREQERITKEEGELLVEKFNEGVDAAIKRSQEMKSCYLGISDIMDLENISDPTQNDPQTERTELAEDEPEKSKTELTEPLSGSEKNHDLFDAFLRNEVKAYFPEDYEYAGDPFTIEDLKVRMEEYGITDPGESDRVDLNNDGRKDLILNGPYGGTYLYEKDDTLYVLAEGEGTAGLLSHTHYNGAEWIVYSDVGHAGRESYYLIKYNGDGKVMDEFDLSAEYWDSPDDRYDENSDFTYYGHPITMQDYERLRYDILGIGEEPKEETGERGTTEKEEEERKENTDEEEGKEYLTNVIDTPAFGRKNQNDPEDGRMVEYDAADWAQYDAEGEKLKEERDALSNTIKHDNESVETGLQEEIQKMNQETYEEASIDLTQRTYSPEKRDYTATWDKTVFYVLEGYEEAEGYSDMGSCSLEEKQLENAENGNLIQYEIYINPENGIANKIVAIEDLDAGFEVTEYYYDNQKQISFIYRYRRDDLDTETATKDKTGERFMFRDDYMVTWRIVSDELTANYVIGENEAGEIKNFPEDTIHIYDSLSEEDKEAFDEKEREMLNAAYITY